MSPCGSLKGQIDGLGTDVWLKVKRADGTVAIEHDIANRMVCDAGEAIPVIFDAITEFAPNATIVAVGHRILHGGVRFDRPVLLDDSTIANLEAFTPFAPLHQPYNLAGVAAAKARPPSPMPNRSDVSTQPFTAHTPE